MVVRMLLLGLFLAGGWANSAGADVFGHLKRAETAVKKLAGDDKDAAGSEAEKSAGDSSAAPASTGKHPAARPAEGRKYPPGLSFSTILNGVQLLSQKGRFMLHHIQATFLPDDGREGYVIIRKADGQELYKVDWKSEQLKKPYFLLDGVTVYDAQTGQKVGNGQMELKEPGDYVVDFYTKAEHFYTFPFSIAKLSGDDPFGDGSFLVLKGDWEDWGYLFYSEAKPERSLQWKVWLRADEAVKEKDVKPRIEITRDADKKLVCISRDITLGIRPEWVRMEFDMIFPKEGTSGGAYFKAKDLLGTDGDYTLTMKLDDKLYGTWKFSIKGGKLQPKGRTLRGKQNPLTFIEGGRDAFWYCREKPASETK